MPYYLSKINVGLDKVASLGDGTSFNLQWFRAYPENSGKIAYNIYYSTNQDTVFSEGPKLISIDAATDANIIDLIPGQMYWFGLRPIEYSSLLDLSVLLPVSHDNIRFFPTSILSSNITAADLNIPLLDVEGFPNTGIIKIGYELIEYSSINLSNLVLTNSSQRGMYGTDARIHNTDGYDGVDYRSQIISLYLLGESNNFDRTYMCQSRFEYPNNAFLITDGYYQVTTDTLTTDLSSSDESNEDFPSYDYAGYHRIDPVDVINGTCVGSYIGGEYGCIDGYGNYNIIRGISVQDRNNQRQEMLLNSTGKPVVLLQRQHTGIVCACYMSNSEYPDDRCPKCLGTKFVLGYNQYFNPRRADGRIMVRTGPTEENLKMYEAGLESEYPLDLWTLTVPTIKNRDVLIMFDIDGNEEFRYEVMGVTRNNTFLGLQGAQKLKVTRIRKTDVAYQISAFKDTSTVPIKLNTSIGFSPGIIPHTHTLVSNENSSNTWVQLTSVSQAHNHEVKLVNGILQISTVLGHSHNIIY